MKFSTPIFKKKSKQMNKKTALCKSLLQGDVINVSNSIRLCGYSNPAREISREIEQPFEVSVEKIRVSGKDQFGNPTTWKNYKLNPYKKENKAGILRMRKYILENQKKSS